jgi:hypothetical protein
MSSDWNTPEVITITYLDAGIELIASARAVNTLPIHGCLYYSDSLDDEVQSPSQSESDSIEGEHIEGGHKFYIIYQRGSHLRGG